MRFDLYVIVGAAAVAAGCATQPVPMSQAQPVPVAQVLSQQWVQPDATRTAELTVRRDSGFTGSACATLVYIDGVQWVELRPGQIARAYLAPGDVVVSARPAPGLCPDSLVETAVALKAGQARHLRVGLSPAMDVMIQPTAF